MNNDAPVPSQYAHMAKAACLLLLHPSANLIGVCSRRDTTIYGFPGGKMDPGETMAQTASRETSEEMGVLIPPEKLESLFADAIPGDRDFWAECFVAVSPAIEIQQMEKGITVKWTTWNEFLQHNAFKNYNRGVYDAYQDWVACRQRDIPFVPDFSHILARSAAPTPSFPGY